MESPYQCLTAADFLAMELSERKQRNKSYSLRAFARDLEMSPSRLSEILSGRHGVSETTADRIATQLKLKPALKKFWKDLVLSESARSQKVREQALERVEKARKKESFKSLEENQFRVISDWYHAAILELIQVQGFQSDAGWIAERLGLSKTQVDQALERLKQVGLIYQELTGWRANTEAYSAFSELPSSAIRKFHRQILVMHMESLLEDHIDDREHLSMILAIPKARLPEFREDMKTFMTQFWQKIEEDEKDDLYSLSLQLCPIRRRGP